MRPETAKVIIEAAKEMGKEVTLRDDYSGRGMYGKQTAAVIGRQNDIIVCIARAGVVLGAHEEARENNADQEENQFIDSDDFLEDIEKLRWDNMGRDDIVMY